MKIAVIDFKSFLSDDVFNTLKRINVEYDVFECDVDIELLNKYDGVIFTGSHDHVYEKGSRTIDIKIFDLNKPIFGVCYGHQLIHHLLGGKVSKAEKEEKGSVLFNSVESELFKNLPDTHHVYMHHEDEVKRLAPGFKNLGYTDMCEFAASQNEDRKIYTVQFHPETKGNDYGDEVYMNFIDIVKNNI